jgi:hypothetical protein
MTTTWIKQEIAYRLQNAKRGYAMGTWNCCTPKTEAAFDKKIESLQAKEAEIETRPS